MLSTAIINPHYARKLQPGANHIRVILQRNPDENAAKKHVILKAAQLPTTRRGNAGNASTELYSDDATNPGAAMTKVMQEVSEYLIASHPAFKFVLNKLHPLEEPQVMVLAQNADENQRFNAQLSLEKLKAFRAKHGHNFDANLGKLNLLAECEKVNTKLHKTNFRFTNTNLVDDLKLFKTLIESQDSDFVEMICYIIDKAIHVFETKLGNTLILPSEIGINTDDFFSHVQFPPQTMLELSKPILECVDAIHVEAEKAMKAMLLHLCGEGLQHVMHSKLECEGGEMLIALLQNYGTLTIQDELSDERRLQELQLGSADPQLIFATMDKIIKRHKSMYEQRDMLEKKLIIRMLQHKGDENPYKNYAQSISWNHQGGLAKIDLETLRGAVIHYWSEHIKTKSEDTPSGRKRRPSAKSIQKQRYGPPKKKHRKEKLKASASKRDSYTCFGCHEKGHAAHLCTQLKGKLLERQKAGEPICNICGKDHITPKCPQFDQKGQNKPKAEAKAVTAMITEVGINADSGPPECSSDSDLNPDDVDDTWLDEDTEPLE